MRREVVNNLLDKCLADGKETILIIYDDSTENMIEIFKEVLLSLGKKYVLEKISIAGCHGSEPTKEIAEQMLKVDAIVCLTKYSLAHTKARKDAEERKIPFLSLPEYNLEILSNPAFEVDYLKVLPTVKWYTDILSQGNVVSIITDKGTDIRLNISERVANCCPGLTNDEFLLGSPPDIESNIAPIEGLSEGVIVLDGSITDYRVGLLEKPVILTIQNGAICEIISEDKKLTKGINDIFEEIQDARAKIIGEFGIGFNDRAELCGNMLVDEGVQGCVHFGMGSNWTIGGKNKINFHLDFVMRNATVYVDDKIIIDKGVLVYAGI